jgi:threonine dehydrogenase-like Zn-dependent dehydrogenase
MKGEKLLCNSFTQLGIHTDGTFAEYVKAPAALLHKLPDNMSFEEGAFIEPVSCVIHAAKAMDACLGSSVAIIGCGLGVLHARMAVLRACAPVIIFGDNRKRLQIAKDMGADYAIHIEDVADPVAEVMRLTNGRGADYAIEAVGTVKTYEQAFAMLRRGGRLSSFGITGEQDPAFLFSTGKQQGILFCIALFKSIRAHRIVPHEPEVPGEGSQHPVGDESRFRRHDERSRSSPRSYRTAGHQGKQNGWKNPAAQ